MQAEWFGVNLKHWRIYRNMNQAELTEKAGLKRGTVEKLEQGKTLPGWMTVCMLCIALDVTAEVFQEEPKKVVKQGRGRPKKDTGKLINSVK